MRVLELFSGTGSITRVFKERGHEVVSLDLDPASGADITMNVLEWDYTVFKPGHFDLIWASPPCTMYSIARTNAKTARDLEGADAVVARTLEIIEWFQPRWWFMENPQTGLLKSRDIVRGLGYRDITYCSYGAPFRKKTRVWTNCSAWMPRPLCDRRVCPAVVEGRHLKTAQRGPCRNHGSGDTCQLADLHAIPPELVLEIHAAVTQGETFPGDIV